MAKKEEKKGVLDKAIDMVSSRDEKEAAAKAVARAEQAEARAERLEAELDAKKEAADKARQAEFKAQLDALRAKKQVKIKAEHTVGEDETLSHIALKYYGSAVRDYWMLIYEANKEVIGDNPSIIRPGMVLKVPELSEEMK
jgi:nucleoid-associated protein YgaU